MHRLSAALSGDEIPLQDEPIGHPVQQMQRMSRGSAQDTSPQAAEEAGGGVSSIDAALYTCPTSGAVYVVKSRWGQMEYDTGACDWEPLEWAGPFSPEQVAILTATPDTSGLDWREGGWPEDWDYWKQGTQLWAEPYEPWEED